MHMKFRLWKGKGHLEAEEFWHFLSSLRDLPSLRRRSPALKRWAIIKTSLWDSSFSGAADVSDLGREFAVAASVVLMLAVVGCASKKTASTAAPASSGDLTPVWQN